MTSNKRYAAMKRYIRLMKGHVKISDKTAILDKENNTHIFTQGQIIVVTSESIQDIPEMKEYKFVGSINDVIKNYKTDTNAKTFKIDFNKIFEQAKEQGFRVIKENTESPNSDKTAFLVIGNKAFNLSLVKLAYDIIADKEEAVVIDMSFKKKEMHLYFETAIGKAIIFPIMYKKNIREFIESNKERGKIVIEANIQEL